MWNRATKRAASEDSTEPDHSGTAKPKAARNVKNSDQASKKQDSTTLVVADTAPQPIDPPKVLKTPEASAEQARQASQPAVPFEAFVLPEPPESTASAASSTAAVAPTDATENNPQPSADPGSLVFQLFLNSSDGTSKTQAVADHKAEAPVFAAHEEESAAPQTRAGESNAEANNQDQQDSPQQPPLTTDGTIASQFGFQTPLSFAAHMTPPKAEAVAPARTVETVSPPELPAAQAVDRIALTLRGADDQVVRVEINQSGEMVQVGVNTANSALASELRTSVPELVHRLDQQGYESKVSMPTFSSSGAALPIATAHSEFRSGADTNGDAKSNGNITSQDEPRQQRQRNSQKAWRELASQLQED